MAFIEYTVKERIIAGHALDDVENHDFLCNVLDYENKQVFANPIAIGGNEESSLIREEDFHTIVVSNIPATDLPLWEEIYFSIMNNYTFTFDPDGLYAAQINPYSCILKSKSYKPQRVGIDTFNLPLSIKRL